MSVRALVFVLLAGCATTRVANAPAPSSPPPAPAPPPSLSPEQQLLLTSLFDAAAHDDDARLKAMIGDLGRFKRVQTWDMTRMAPSMCGMLVSRVDTPQLGWTDMSLADLRKRLGFVAPGGVPPTAEGSRLLDELHRDDTACPRAAALASEVLVGAQEVTYRGGDGSTLTLLLVGNELAGIVGTPGK
jgi:hypothetical protein